MSKGPSKFAEKCCVFLYPGYRAKRGEIEMLSSYWEYSNFVAKISDNPIPLPSFSLLGISFTSRKGWGKLVLK